jgi:zinc-finger
MIVSVPHSESHPFVWFPLARQRHAIDQQDRNVPLGALTRCLCDDTYPRGTDGDTEWLWPTCKQCWNETCVIVGLRPRR